MYIGFDVDDVDFDENCLLPDTQLSVSDLIHDHRDVDNNEIERNDGMHE